MPQSGKGGVNSAPRAFGCGNQRSEMASEHPGGRLHLLHQADSPSPLPTLQRRMLLWAEPASKHPPPPSHAGPHLPPSRSRCLRGLVPQGSQAPPERLSSAPRDTNAASPGLSSAWTRRKTNRVSRTHLIPTAWSAPLPVDWPPQEAKTSVGSDRAHLSTPPSSPPPPRHITGPSGGNAGSRQPRPPPPAQLHPSRPVLPVAVWRAVEAVGPL